MSAPKQPPVEPLYMSVAQYAAHLAVSTRTVKRRIAANHIPLRKSLQPAPAPPEVPLSRLSEIAFRSGDFIVRDRGHEGTHDAV
jgi:hypothetical protein